LTQAVQWSNNSSGHNNQNLEFSR